MSALTCLYQTLGVYKPYSLYLEQAKKLAASLHTNYHWSDPHEKVLISTDLSAKEGPGFFYIQHVSSVSCIQEAWAILNGSSPAKFKSFVYCSIQSRSLSTVDAVGMLNISSWLEFERRHQYDQLDLRNPTIIRDEPIVSEENFEAFIKTHSRQRSNFSTICLFYDNTFDKLIISVHKTEPVLMVIPFHGKSFTAQSCVEMIQSIMDKNKEILFGHTKSSVAVDIQSAEFKRNWWKARKELDAQLAEIAERINNEWLAPFSVPIGAMKTFSNFLLEISD